MLDIGDIVYNHLRDKIGWITKHNKNSDLWTIQYSDDRIEKHSGSAIQIFKSRLDKIKNET